MKKQIGFWTALAFVVLATLAGAGMNSGLTAQNVSKPAKPATDEKSSSGTESRIARIELGIEPLEVEKGKPPRPLDIEELMKLYNVPGLSVAVVDNYKIAWTKCYGVTEPGGKLPVTSKTLFQAGSISKPVAAAGMLAMVEQGKLSLDEDVNQKLKTWKVPENEFTKEQKVTLRRLASHSAGLTVHGFPGYDVDEKVPALVQIFNGEKPANTAPIRVDFVPGTNERYSGGGITIEQQLMIDVSGEPFPVLMKETVLDKAGMSDSSYEQPLPSARAAFTAAGAYGDGRPVHGRWHVYPEMAAAGLWTTPTDLANFAIEIALSKQGKSNKVLSQEMAQVMLTQQSKDFGIGFGLSPDRPGEFGHNGADEGFQALLVMNVDTGQGAALMANSDNGNLLASEFLRSIAREYRWKYAEARGPFEELTLTSKLAGVDAVLQKYNDLKSAPDTKRHPPEFVLNALGYSYLQKGQTNDAIRLFEKNVSEHPDSSNVYDSLAEAYAAAGKKQLAIENYQKSVQLDPKNQNGIVRLKKLKDQQ
jgi:CubicO group peptidase (beta-lactamase class C family)